MAQYSSTSTSSSATGDHDRCTNVSEDLSDNAPDSVNQPAVSLLSRLRAPASSELSLKRKCASNPPSGKRRSRGSNYVTEPKSVKSEQRVRKYPKEPFVVSNGALFCCNCRQELCLQSSSVKNHIRSVKHRECKQKLEKKQAREKDIAKALLVYNKEVHPHGEMLPPNQQQRVKHFAV